MPKQNNLLQDQWSSKWAFILAATGAAVGLGNVWRFPYMTGMNGGSAFVLVYIICVVLMGLPIMISEILIGRRGRKNPIDSLKDLAIIEGRTKHWGLLGWWGALALLLVLSFYSVVSGWAIAYLVKSFTDSFAHANAQQVAVIWQNFLANPWHLLFWHSVFMVLTMIVVARGVNAGLEKASKIMMPALYIILFVLVGFAATSGDFIRGAHFLFDFNLAKITPSVVVAAMGHAFFTLALGAGAMLAYGAYVPRNINLASCVIIVAGLDVLVAILSGLAIFPLVFEYHLNPSSGPGLMFVTLPIAFAQIPFGSLVGGLFFLLLIFAAWTSSINLAEPMVVIAMSRWNIDRKIAAILVGILAWFIGIGSLLSFNVWSNIKFFHQFTVFDIATNIPTDIILPIGGFGFAVFAGWVMSKKATQEEVHPQVYPIWRFLVRYVATAFILIVFICSIISL